MPRSPGSPDLAGAARIALVVMFGGACLLGPGCRRSDERPAGRSAEAILPPDTTFPGDQPVPVHEVSLRQEILLPESPTVGEEPAVIRTFRRQLASRSALESRILLHPLRAVWELPESAMPGGAADPLYLVMRPRNGKLALVSHRRRRYRAGSPARLAAWIEGSLRASGPLVRLEVLGRREEPAGADGRPARRELHLLAVIRVSQASGPPMELRRRILVISEESPASLRAQAALLWDALLLPLLPTTSAPVLEPLRAGGHWPRRLEILPTQPEPGDVAGVGWKITLDPAAGRVREVPRLWLRLPPERYEPEFGPLLFRPARRLLHRSTRGLRDRVKGEPDNEPISLRNVGDRTLYVYADGLLLGWVGPRGEARWKILPPGYYRVAAHSLFGTELWGPKDVFLPGPIILKAQ